MGSERMRVKRSTHSSCESMFVCLWFQNPHQLQKKKKNQYFLVLNINVKLNRNDLLVSLQHGCFKKSLRRFCEVDIYLKSSKK